MMVVVVVGGGGGVKSHVPVNGTLSYWQRLLSYTTGCNNYYIIILMLHFCCVSKYQLICR